MSHRKQKTLKGFSLGEVILSVVVLTVGLLPILGSMSGALKTTLDSEDATTAAGLAQEGAELVVNVRDNAFACQDSDPACASYVGFEKFPGDRKYCRIDYDGNNNNNNANVGNNDVFLYNTAANRGEEIQCRLNNNSPGDRYFDLVTDANGFYRITNNGTESKFKRQIVFDFDGSSTYVAYSIVTWGGWRPIHDLGQMENDTVAQVIGKLAECTSANKCLYTQVSLSAWK